MADILAKNVIEAILFSNDKPVTIEQIRNVFADLEPAEIRAIIEELKQEYENGGRGLRIVEVAGGFQMVTSGGFASYLKKFYKKKHADKFSRQSLETLAIIAYKQPVTRFEIESIRGVNIDGVMKHLKDLGVIRISGRRLAPGRPFVYGTTREFLEYFGLKSLDELPKMEDFSSLVSSEISQNKEIIPEEASQEEVNSSERAEAKTEEKL